MLRPELGVESASSPSFPILPGKILKPAVCGADLETSDSSPVGPRAPPQTSCFLRPLLLSMGRCTPEERPVRAHQSVHSASATGACLRWYRCTCLGWLPGTLHSSAPGPGGRQPASLSLTQKKEKAFGDTKGNGHQNAQPFCEGGYVIPRILKK